MAACPPYLARYGCLAAALLPWVAQASAILGHPSGLPPIPGLALRPPFPDASALPVLPRPPELPSDSFMFLARRRASQSHQHRDIPALLLDHNSACNTVLLTNVFTSRPDPQTLQRHTPNFDYFDHYFRSVMSVPGGRVKAVVLHDGLPENLTKALTPADGTVSFAKVDISKLDNKTGLNDLRFEVFLDQLEHHPEWDTVFLTDISDVTVLHNPCALVEENRSKLFVGSEPSLLRSNMWMRRKFKEMGGKYWAWYESAPHNETVVKNAGIIGGKREVMLAFLRRLTDALQDPDLADRKRGHLVTANMPALNWVLGTEYQPGDLVTGRPLHSGFKKYEHRRDVYFEHK